MNTILKKAKEKKKPQISQLKGAKAKVMTKPKLAVSKPSVVAKTKAVAKSQSKPLSGGQRSMDMNKNNLEGRSYFLKVCLNPLASAPALDKTLGLLMVVNGQTEVGH